MRRMLVTCFAAFSGLAGLAGSTNPAVAALPSATSQVILILAGDLFLGEAKGNLDESGTMVLQSRSAPDMNCLGQSTFSAETSGTADIRCSDGVTAAIQFQRLSRTSGYGVGSSSRGAVSFSYGLSSIESELYLKLPAGKALRGNGADLMLVNSTSPVPPIIRVSNQIPFEPRDAPDALLSAATLSVVAALKQDRHLKTSNPEKFAKLLESTVLPLFDFRHMTQLAVARNWRLATPEQQGALVAGFRTLLVHAWSTALTDYHDQVIEYKPLRMAPGETDVTVKSRMQQARTDAMTIDYDMEKTASGWKIYDVRLSGISLVSTYRSPFAETIRDRGVDGLIESLAWQSRQAESASSSQESGAHYLLLMYSVIQNFFRGDRQQ